jgi:hypothetical protein
MCQSASFPSRSRTLASWPMDASDLSASLALRRTGALILAALGGLLKLAASTSQSAFRSAKAAKRTTSEMVLTPRCCMRCAR